nr:ankyrin repeat domain-containing protein [Gammaproteobacteria bacterium]
LPVKLITELDLSLTPTQLGNPYDPEYSYVNVEEYKRLVAHSSLTQAVFDTKREYELLSGDKSTLLGQLNQLCQQLSLNMVGNLGEETNAGSGAYPAIINFRSYYMTLPEREKNKIPTELKKEIDGLLDVAFNKEVNTNATEDIGTCIASRRTVLIEAMSGHDELLSQIALSGTEKESLVVAARTNFNAAKNKLVQAIENNTYTEGHDEGGLNTSLLEKLGLELKIMSLSDLDMIQLLTPTEITNVCASQSLRKEVVTQLQTLENLVIFAMGLSPEKLSAFLRANKDEIMNVLIKSPSNIKSFLISFNDEKSNIILNELKFNFSDIIKNGSDFCDAIERLSVEHRVVLFDAMIAKLPNIIESGEGFSKAMGYLAVEQRAVLFRVMQGKWSDIMKTDVDFGSMVGILLPEQFAVMFDELKMKGQLPDLIKTFDDFLWMMENLSAEQCMALVSIMKVQWHDIFKTGFDFGSAMEGLLVEERAILFDAVEKTLPDIIETANDFVWAKVYLSEKQSTILVDAMEEKWSDIIKTVDDFLLVKQYLSAEEAGQLIKNAKSILSRACHEGDIDFVKLLINEGVKPTEAMFLQACKNDKLEIAQILALKLIPDVIDSLDFSASNKVVSHYVEAISENNLTSLAEVGLRDFVLNQHESQKTLTSRFKKQLDDIKQPEQETEQLTGRISPDSIAFEESPKQTASVQKMREQVEAIRGKERGEPEEPEHGNDIDLVS